MRAATLRMIPTEFRDPSRIPCTLASAAQRLSQRKSYPPLSPGVEASMLSRGDSLLSRSPWLLTRSEMEIPSWLRFLGLLTFSGCPRFLRFGVVSKARSAAASSQ